MSRSIFEEVDRAAEQKQPIKPGAADAKRQADRRLAQIWLLILSAMIIIQILIGGMTRLTDSGLSITEWNLVTGTLPPLSDTAWSAAFAQYQKTAEYQQQNTGMSLSDFKTIYWWEWGHRFWGRIIGLATLVPLAFFWVRKRIPPGYGPRLAGFAALIVVQGVVGWWMVQSGLSERLDVSQYRLAAHLFLAFAALGLALWMALALKWAEWENLAARRRRELRPRRAMQGLFAVASVQIIIGAFVAGMDGGVIYTQWPLMGDGFFPSNEPFHPFENPAAAQFSHRIIGYVLCAVAIAAWLTMRRSAFAKTKRWANIALGAVFLQAVIGVATLVHHAPLSWSIIHQCGAIAVFMVLIHAWRQVSYPIEEKR